jgi:hypothetical protein
MSQLAAESAFDIMGSGNHADLKNLREEVSDFDLKIKKSLDIGLTTDEFPTFEGLKAAADAALAILDDLYSRVI